MGYLRWDATNLVVALRMMQSANLSHFLDPQRVSTFGLAIAPECEFVYTIFPKRGTCLARRVSYVTPR
jgi:hypothetical protein